MSWSRYFNKNLTLIDDNAPIELYAVLIDAAQLVTAFLHIDGHLVVEAGGSEETVVEGPIDGFPRIAVGDFEDDLLAVAFDADGDGDAGVGFG